MAIVFSKELLAHCREHFAYDPTTGVFTRLKNFRGNNILYEKSRDGGHLTLCTNNQHLPAAVVAYWLMTGEDIPAGKLIDHKDRIKDNNKWENLRVYDKQGNAHNSNVRANNRTGVTGVYPGSRRPNTWHARIKHGKMILLGTYDTFEDAVQARLHAEMKYVGEIVTKHVAHMYDPDAVIKGRQPGQWRKEDNKVSWSIVDGKRHWHQDTEQR